MGYSRRIAMAIILAMSAAPGTQPAATSRGLAGSPPLLARESSRDPDLQALETSSATATIGTATIYADTDEQIELANQALRAMADANLRLPAVVINLHTNRTDCSSDGSLSGYYTVAETQHVIHSCGGLSTLLHELAHVWDSYQLDDETRQQILEHQQLDLWYDDEWKRSGSEHLASIVSWALDGTHPTLIGYYTRQQLAEAYAIATGNEAPTLGGGPLHTRTGTTAAQDAVIDHALERFDQAGLELPGIDFYGYQDNKACAGNRGVAARRDHRTEIRLCVDGNGHADDWVILHEIAHAWDYYSLTDDLRDELLGLRSLDAWREGEWTDRGAEHTAEIMVWGLIDREVNLVRIGQDSCEELLNAYRTLTGTDPLNPYAASCESAAA